MKTSIAEAIAAAKAQNRFLSNIELQAAVIQAKLTEAGIEAARILTTKAQSLVEGAAQAVYQKFPNYTSTAQSKGKCARDINYYLRLIQYCLVATNTEPLDEYLITGLDEITPTLNLSHHCAIEALNYIKVHHGLTDQAALLTNTYIDYTINVLTELREDENQISLTSDSQEGKENSYPSTVKPLWERLAEIGAQVPEAERKKQPKDLARNFEHYMYGAPKEE